jgi:CheY-like chemotaxis protein
LESQTSPSTKRILLVDDDPVVVRIYQQGLTRLGFQVITASDGLEALRALRKSTPDVVVLDLMMPKFSGAEVLRFIRSRPGGESMPVIILSNAYMDPGAHDAADMGAHGLLKVKCTPASLALEINELLEGKSDLGTPEASRAIPEQQKPRAEAPAEVSAEPQPAENPAQSVTPPPGPAVSAQDQARAELATHSAAVIARLRESYLTLSQASDERERKLRLDVLYRQVHFVTGLAGLAGYHAISQMASALEALLFSLIDKPANMTASVDRTLSLALEYLRELLREPRASSEELAAEPQALVVDDDKLSNRLVVTALRNASLHAKGTDRPEEALRWLQEKVYDLILLDVEMPGMDGIQLCKRLRTLPGYADTPVIYVTLHSDFETRVRTLSSSGMDLIAKPIVPAELGVKAIMHLLKHQRATAG